MRLRISFVSNWAQTARRTLPLALPVLLATCSEAGNDATDDGSAGGFTPGGVAGRECNVTVIESPPDSQAHVTQCTPITYSTNPPSGGPHYAIWAAYGSYDFPVPAGYLMHSLEHGAVVFWYNCPEGCAGELAEVEAFIAALPEDPLCAGMGAERRTVLLPWPELGSRWAASTWGFALTADCFDPTAFRTFYDDHYGRGREALCAPPEQVFTADPCL